MTFTNTDVASLADSLSNSTLTSSKKPHLLFCAAPADGHTNPLLRIAGELITRGFDVTFIGGTQFESQFKAIGATHVPLATMLNPKIIAERNAIPAGLPRLVYDMREFFVGSIPERWAILKATLEDLKKKDPNREIVVVTETMFMGFIPLLLGAPLPSGFTTRPKVVGLHVVPYIATSIDTGPAGPGLPFDPSASGRARNQFINHMMVNGPFADVIAYQTKLLSQLGATEILEPELPFHHWMLIPDVTLQMCPPSLEYPRSDMPSNVRFAGCLLPKPVSADFEYPEWWEDVTKGDRKVVTVTQGTVATVYSDLIIPTIEALSSRNDLLVVVILGERNASLPESTTIPTNTRIIDYLPYDAILPHTSVFVMNAGYGGFLHGVTNGVPMVLAGETEDKLEVSARGAWAGVAVNLRTGTPSLEMIREGVDEILGDEEAWRARVGEVRRENEGMGVFDVVEREIMAVLE